MATRAPKLQTVEGALNDDLKAIIHPNLAAAMTAAFAEIEGATKAATNPHFKSKYADLTSIIEAIKPPLIRHGLFFTQRCHPDQEGVSVETVLHHSGGEKESLGTLFVPANKRDAQGFGSALTYARRYALQTAFGVPTEDDDGNAAVATAASRSMSRGVISMDQFNELSFMLEKSGVTAERFCKRFQIGAVASLPADKFAEAKAALENKIKEPA